MKNHIAHPGPVSTVRCAYVWKCGNTVCEHYRPHQAVLDDAGKSCLNHCPALSDSYAYCLRVKGVK